ncbi:hypothetical protein DICVIV_10910 [Dictyocaulus viviparus]|uniref:Uncharacterized protein n=1 Tax=Dictyocaulus viviparus TaxID=29172 RepID=A0A0D8XH61_DICVI|nr:hypothetical protein DICVIV_10910 [Dictyocaulus viviparus]
MARQTPRNQYNIGDGIVNYAIFHFHKIFRKSVCHCNEVFPLMLIYLCAYTSWIYVQQPTAINKKVARGFSLPIWIYGLSCISYYFGVFKAAVFGTLTIILTLLSIGVWVVEDSKDSGDVKESTVGPVDHDVPVEKSDAVTIVSLDKAFGSDSLILMMAGLCVLSWIVRHDAALFFIFIPFLFAVFRKIGKYCANVGFSSTITTLCISVRDHLYPSFKKIVDTTISGYLRQFVKVLFTSDQMLVSSLHSKMDVLSSLVVMGFLACSVIFSLLFIGFQLHSETVHIVRLTNNVVSSRPDWLGAAMNFTEDQLEGHDINIDKYVEKAYQQGRAYLASNIRALADTKDTARADMLEEQVMKVVDNLYKMWEERNSASEATTPNGLRGDRKTQLMSLTNLNTFKEEIILIVKENIDMLTSIASSVWGIVSANIAFLLTLMGALAGLILNFGLDIINLVIEVIVFLTMVYYLLSASRDRWLPIEWISNLATLTSISSNKSSTTSVTENDVTIAIEQAIFLLILPLLFVFAAMFSGVFVLSSKMAIFYGLYTYFIHTLFDLNVVFVPCMLAALFAAIPIMPTYIVSLFGVFELWLVRGELSATVVFAVLSFAPQMFANATFYKEVKFSHPYVTGLAIIGGMYWLGLEGAIIGPIILCSFLVLINVYMQVARPCGGKLKAG